ncbi:hypothetical protein PG997_000260 [Apiospora hydei]|uniref:Uncharacterized protein n=1 Tax=Apiospora hydei TaxID=1337664 RepID=A0ABR1XA44_9PEZI
MDRDALELVRQAWRPLGKELFNGDPSSEMDHGAYLDYYTKQWHLMMGPTRTADILGLLQRIQAGKPRLEVLAQLQGKGPQGVGPVQADVEVPINLALRLISMMKFGIARGQIMPRRCLAWNQGSLKEYLADYFGKPPVLNCDRVRLPKSFHAWSIEKIGGIDVCFTDNLADHLLLVEDDSKLLIFHHVCFLEYQHHDGQNALFPDGLINETLRTLALLFPEAQFGRKRTRGGKWLGRKREVDRVLDARLAHCGNLQMEERQIEHFTYWRDRLVILKQAYDDATPGTLSQWWYDRRNGVQR